MDKLRKIIRYNKKVMLFLTIIVIIGIVSGSILTVILNTNDKEIVTKSVELFAKNIDSGTYNIMDSIKNVFITNIFILLLIWILGISIFGIFIVVVIIFWKSFTIGFTISSFILTYQIKGLLFAFIYIFPSLILNILFFMYLSTYSIDLSFILIKSIVGKKTLNFRFFMRNYMKVLLTSLAGIIISGLYEVFINPYILKFIGNFL